MTRDTMTRDTWLRVCRIARPILYSSLLPVEWVERFVPKSITEPDEGRGYLAWYKEHDGKEYGVAFVVPSLPELSDASYRVFAEMIVKHTQRNLEKAGLIEKQAGA